MPWYRMRTDSPGPLAGCSYHVKLDRRHATLPCQTCGDIAELRCDRIVDHNVLKHGEPLRCDRWICVHCATEPVPGKHLCPPCAQLYKGWLAARSNSTDGEGP